MSVLLQWLGIQKRVGNKKKEVVVLQSQEQRVEKEEIKLVEGMIRKFTEGTQYNLILSYRGIIDGKKSKSVFPILSKVEGDLLNLKIYNTRLSKLARRLSADLLDMRGASNKNDLRVIRSHLSEDERRVFAYILRINEEIDEIVEKIRYLKSNIDHYDRKVDNTESILKGISTINNLLVSLKTHLVELFTLEQDAEKLMKEYVKQ
jgi:hypothetical protein